MTSQPVGSVVTIKDPRGNIKRTAETPINIDLNQQLLGQDDFLMIEVTRTGFVTKSFIVPKTFFASDHSLAVTLEKDARLSAVDSQNLDQCEQISKKSLTELSKGVAIAQANLMKGDLQIATTQVNTLITSYPFVSVLYDLQGNIYYLQKQFAQALSAYEKSMTLDPQNVETAIMVKKLRQIMGKADLPAQGGGLP